MISKALTKSKISNYLSFLVSGRRTGKRFPISRFTPHFQAPFDRPNCGPARAIIDLEAVMNSHTLSSLFSAYSELWYVLLC